jgi:glucokinase
MILAGDIGGTKTLLGLFDASGGRPRVVREASFPSADHDSFEAILDRFLAGRRVRIDSCAIGVAGPVVGGRSRVVNLRWPVDAAAVAARLGLAQVRLLNDLEAGAWGLAGLAGRQLVPLAPGLRARPGNAALIAAGTGLGMAVLYWDGERHHPSASEGGHQGFAPRDDLELELSRYLREEHGRASIERAVSGPAFSTLYRFLVATGRARETKRMRAVLEDAADPNAAITAAGLARTDATASQALDLFVSLYGAAAGDLALGAKAVGGVFVGGGIAPRILERLKGGGFMRSFRSKGRLSPLVERVPVRVVLEPRTALLGAAACASRRGR